MKLRRKIMASALALTMLLTAAAPGFAAEGIGSTAETNVAATQEAAAKAVSLSKAQVQALKPKAKAESYSYTKIRVKWEKLSGLDGYQIYRATSKNGTYKKVFITTKDNYINSDRTTGKTYWYKVRGYKVISGKTCYTKYSAPASAYARPNKAKIKSADYWNSNFVIDWDKVSGASGYQLQIKVKDSDPWKTYYLRKNGSKSYPKEWDGEGIASVGVKYITTNTAAVWNVNDDEPQFQFRVRAYRNVKGKKVYGLYSKAYKVLPKYDAEKIDAEIKAYVKEKYPNGDWYNTTYDTEKKQTIITDFPDMTPEYDSSFGITWSMVTVNQYETLDSLKRIIDYYFPRHFAGDPCGCLYIRQISAGEWRMFWLN